MSPIKAPKKTGLSPLWKVHLAGLTCCLVLSTAAYALAIHPWMTADDQLDALITQLAQQELQATQAAKKLAQLQRHQTEIDLALASVPSQLAPSTQLNLRLTAMTTLAASSGLEIHSILPGAAVLEPRYQASPIQLSGSGSFSAWTVFLRALHRELPDVAVVAFELDSPPSPDLAKPPRFSLWTLWYATPAPTPQTAQTDGPPPIDP